MVPPTVSHKHVKFSNQLIAVTDINIGTLIPNLGSLCAKQQIRQRGCHWYFFLPSFMSERNIENKLTDVESYNLKLWFIPVLKQLNVELKAWIVEWHTKNIINYNFMDLFKGHNQYLCFYLHLTWKINAIPFIYQLMTISIILIHHTFFKD